MFDIGFFELIVIFVLALLVLGPERLPRVARTAGRWLSRARQMARNMQYELEREIDLADMRASQPADDGPPTPHDNAIAGAETAGDETAGDEAASDEAGVKAND